ncbi:AsnC family transcriptional regulator [Alisedimentitalea sp. MJ-SS2]|uniref:Lrp/AsnC family transcriptional regulator n=1 Tax=Aliisedimentitalea sp. MJ-SS2 TaxID=3049795 RepID=UPI002914226F|nr:AsnC family transcriptional regulator [Alisedimentitalea sp. MJ-SS2]MDU8927191.1 AsnC family transcriptional regulator [Alisedimentitalea sp. MJ-SS2]
MSTLDDIDRALINALQDDLPLTHRPFAPLAERLGLTEEALLTRVKALRESGVLTRFGPFFDAAAMGGAFCLCAMAVPAEDFEKVMTQVNAHEEVAHNYERQHRLNMWFVLATETPEGITQTADAIEQETGLIVHRFPKLQEFYIGFRVAA